MVVAIAHPNSRQGYHAIEDLEQLRDETALNPLFRPPQLQTARRLGDYSRDELVECLGGPKVKSSVPRQRELLLKPGKELQVEELKNRMIRHFQFEKSAEVREDLKFVIQDAINRGILVKTSNVIRRGH